MCSIQMITLHLLNKNIKICLTSYLNTIKNRTVQTKEEEKKYIKILCYRSK